MHFSPQRRCRKASIQKVAGAGGWELHLPRPWGVKEVRSMDHLLENRSEEFPQLNPMHSS